MEAWSVLLMVPSPPQTHSLVSLLTLSLLALTLLSPDNLCKQFGPRLGRTLMKHYMLRTRLIILLMLLFAKMLHIAMTL